MSWHKSQTLVIDQSPFNLKNHNNFKELDQNIVARFSIKFAFKNQKGNCPNRIDLQFNILYISTFAFYILRFIIFLFLHDC